ncbi:MAG: hypothetical protein JXC33_08415 [Deltaproteobacteria bacterium]|nr:hypothetical protein [Deltaproteobacteria bacterium]
MVIKSQLELFSPKACGDYPEKLLLQGGKGKHICVLSNDSSPYVIGETVLVGKTRG